MCKFFSAASGSSRKPYAVENNRTSKFARLLTTSRGFTGHDFKTTIISQSFAYAFKLTHRKKTKLNAKNPKPPARSAESNPEAPSPHTVQGLGFRGFTVQGLGLRVYGLGFKVWRVQGLGV